MPLARLLALPALALAVLAFPAMAAAAGPISVQNDRVAQARDSGTGYDISYPQCDHRYPRDPAFGIVGVNGGIVFSPNRCLGSQLVWADVGAQLYANTGNPGPELSTHWPTGQSTPRVCSAGSPDSLECAYDYGWNAAADSYRTAVDAYVALGRAPKGATRTPTAKTWWLDVRPATAGATMAATSPSCRVLSHTWIGRRRRGGLLFDRLPVGTDHGRQPGLCPLPELGCRGRDPPDREALLHRDRIHGWSHRPDAVHLQRVRRRLPLLSQHNHVGRRALSLEVEVPALLIGWRQTRRLRGGARSPGSRLLRPLTPGGPRR